MSMEGLQREGVHMRSKRRACITLIAASTLAVSAPAAHASFGVTESNFEAGTCVETGCTYASPHSSFYTQAAGHPPWGITAFELNHSGEEPEGSLKRIRVDVPAGLAANPQALPQCKRSEFEANACNANTEVGNTELVAFDGLNDITVTGKVYNLEPTGGLPLIFGINTGVEPLVNVHIYLEGHVDWSGAHPGGAYHEYFVINNIPQEGELLGVKVPLKVLKSKLNFNGRAGAGNFLTLPSVCSSSTTSYLEVESYAGEISKTETHTPVGVEGCVEVPFKPTISLAPETSVSDQPDGATAIVKAPQNAESVNTSDIKDVRVTLPEGLTLNPSAAHGLEACTPAQIGIGTRSPVTCPAASRVGEVTIETDLPAKSLSGNVYLGNPSGHPAITEPPYTIYLDAESPYDVSVRLQGTVIPNPSSGRLEVTFLDNPPLPFSELILSLRGGPRAPLANPLACKAGAQVQALFTPYTGTPPVLSTSPFLTTGCPSPLPFSLGQNTQSSSPVAGASTSYALTLRRADGQQHLAQVRTTLPAGLIGVILSVHLCGEPQAQAGTCPPSSKIGTATVGAGSGPEPYSFSGPVFLTTHYGGSPYGLSIPVAAVAGPFNLGTVVTRAGINVDPYTARVIATSTLPTIVGGVPLRLKSVAVNINRKGFLYNPTNCGPLATDSLLTSTLGATNTTSSPFQVGKCDSLAFKPSFQAATSDKASKKNGAALQVNVSMPAHEANIRSVVAALPIQLPSRLSTLQKACVGATFDANPAACPAASKVGSATVRTPVLPGRLSGPAYLVSRGGAAFPDLDLILEGNGVRVILVGNTNIKNGVTTSTFASVPDVPVSSFALDLPMGPNSVLSAFGNLCLRPLLMPTTITAQSGAQIRQSTRISVTGCSVRILSRRVRGHKLILKVRTRGAGLLKVTGKGIHGTSKRVRKSSTVTFKLSLSRGSLKALHRHPHHALRVSVHVSFTPTRKGALPAAASTTVKFKR